MVESSRVSSIRKLPLEDRLLNPAMLSLVQVKMVPGVLLVGIYENGVPLQISGNVLALLKTGIGFTTTLNVNGFPKQPPELAPGMIGVRLYTATEGKSVRFLRLPVMLVVGMMVFSVPPINPVPRVGLLHRKTAPTLFGGLMVKLVPLQTGVV